MNVGLYLILSEGCHLGRFGKCGIIGGSISLGAGFLVSKPQTIPSSLLFYFMLAVQEVTPQY